MSIFTYFNPAVLATIFCLFVWTRIGSAQPDIIKIAQPYVSVTIENPNQMDLLVYQQAKTEKVLVARYDAEQPQVSLSVPLGSYQVVGKIGKKSYAYPIPAFIASQQPLKVRLELPPHQTKKDAATWCYIPTGPAIVGDTLGIGSEDERPAKLVKLRAYWLGKTEITNAQYVEFLNSQKKDVDKWLDLHSRQCKIEWDETSQEFKTDFPRYPVVMVSYWGAKAYCKWMTEQKDQIHRLPSEAEWEKAARGPGSTVYSYGNVYRRAMANQESGTIREVGGYRPSAYGLLDMTGNVFEWTADLYDSKKPQSPLNQTLRGGSFVLDGMYLRNSFRMRQSPSVMTDDIGFRVLREVKLLSTENE